jgi:hypothetical protein
VSPEDDDRRWSFELGSAGLTDVQRALDEAIATALNADPMVPGELSEGVGANQIDLTDQPAVDIRSLMTASLTGQGVEREAVELVISIASGLTVATAQGIWTSLVLPALRKRFGDDAVGKETTSWHVGDGRHVRR